jgi:hypothetical protein
MSDRRGLTVKSIEPHLFYLRCCLNVRLDSAFRQLGSCPCGSFIDATLNPKNH